jgi:hypothetical protein
MATEDFTKSTLGVAGIRLSMGAPVFKYQALFSRQAQPLEKNR